MKLRDWVNEHEEFYYRGDVWGEYSGKMTAEDVIECLDALGVGNPEFIEHPTNSGYHEYGYYLESGNLHYRGRGSRELILEVTK